jgi:hypothetical protein
LIRSVEFVLASKDGVLDDFAFCSLVACALRKISDSVVLRVCVSDSLSCLTPSFEGVVGLIMCGFMLVLLVLVHTCFAEPPRPVRSGTIDPAENFMDIFFTVC